jgi:serine/threonine protein kinase/tetratricopeptide (TPR) repeat protein
MSAVSFAPGTVLHERFVIVEEVGAGGMGTVFRAHDLMYDAPVALKVLASRDRSALTRFDRETQLLQDLSAPGIVRYVAHGLLPSGSPYLVMEWLDGEDLSRRLGRQPLRLFETLALGMAVASALAAAHQSGVTHRDIKPANLFLPDGDAQRVKLLDFGIARLFGAEAATRTGTVVGTPDYMAPEQVRGDRDIDGRADLFSLGCVLYECLCGQPPFASEQLMGVFGKILFEPAPDLAAQHPELPPALCQLVTSLLEKDRSRRPARAEDVLSALTELSAGPLSERSSPQVKRPPRAHGLTDHEQRLLSIVVVAARPPSGADDSTVTESPEQTFLGLLRDLAQPFGARSEQLPDGSVLALLTGQATAIDQARQAARLALHVRERWRQRNDATPQNLVPSAVRIAVCTGRGDLLRGVLDAGSIERAATLLARASQPIRQHEDGEYADVPILLDDMTRGLLDSHFLTQKEAGLHVLLSEQPIAEPVRLVLGQRTPFFGRERELGLLQAVLKSSATEPRARVVLVTAEAGMGKSRLSIEFLQHAVAEHKDLSVWIGRGDPLSAGSPFGLLANSLRQALHLPAGADPGVQREKLRHYVGERLPQRDDKRRVCEFLEELLLLRDDAQSQDGPSPALAAARLDAMLMGDQIRRAVLDLLTAECKKQPLLWVLEDLHWGDLPTVQLVDAAVRQLAEEPLCVLVLARPTVHELFPRLFHGRGVQELRLSGLSRKASEKIARAVLGETQQVDSVLALLERAGGNAFFLEEMLRAAFAGQLDEAPATVLAMVQSRIERLLPQARRVLRAACVFGAIFFRGGVSQLLGDSVSAAEVGSWLDMLAERELIARRPESRFPKEAEYTFVHALVRDAAYAMLTDEDRALGHRLAAQYLEGLGERDQVMLAEHFERGGELQKASAGYRRAAWQALEGNDLDAVLRHAERAIACGLSGEELGEMHAARLEAQLWRGDFPDAVRCGQLALELLSPRTPRWFIALANLAVAAGRQTNVHLLKDTCARLQEVSARGERSDAFVIAAVRTALQLYIASEYEAATALFDSLTPIMEDPAPRAPAVEAMLCLLRGNRAGYEWRYDVAIKYYLQSAAMFEEIGDLRNAGSQKLDAAMFGLDTGDYVHTETLAREIIASAKRLGLGRLYSIAQGALAAALYNQGRFDEVLELGGPLLELGRQSGDKRLTGLGHFLYANIYRLSGDYTHAEEEIKQAIADLYEMPRFHMRSLGLYARIQLGQGRRDEALANAEQAFTFFKSRGRLGTDEAGIRMAYCEALRAHGRDVEADDILREGQARLYAQADCIADARARAGFLSIRDHAELLSATSTLTPT